MAEKEKEEKAQIAVIIIIEPRLGPSCAFDFEIVMPCIRIIRIICTGRQNLVPLS
jgi:hypothetical protein